MSGMIMLSARTTPQDSSWLLLTQQIHQNHTHQIPVCNQGTTVAGSTVINCCFTTHPGVSGFLPVAWQLHKQYTRRTVPVLGISARGGKKGGAKAKSLTLTWVMVMMMMLMMC
jgi:hypothetical protein